MAATTRVPREPAGGRADARTRAARRPIPRRWHSDRRQTWRARDPRWSRYGPATRGAPSGSADDLRWRFSASGAAWIRRETAADRTAVDTGSRPTRIDRTARRDCALPIAQET